MKFQEIQIEALKMEIRRMVRLYGRNELPDKVADFVMDKCQPYNIGQDGPQTSEGFMATTTIEKIIIAVTEHFGVSLKQLESKHRKRELVYARQVGMYLLRTNTYLPLRAIGKIFCRDYTTVIHSRNLILDLMSRQPEIKNEIKYLINKISS